MRAFYARHFTRANTVLGFAGDVTLDQVSAAKDVLSHFPHVLAGIAVTGIKPRGGTDDVVYAHAYESS